MRLQPCGRGSRARAGASRGSRPLASAVVGAGRAPSPRRRRAVRRDGPRDRARGPRHGRWRRGSGSRGGGSGGQRSARRGSRSRATGVRPALERAAVLRARAVREHGAVCARGDVADVRREAVARVERVEPPHEPVARHLRDDRRGRDRGALRVAVDDGDVRRGQRPEPEAVDEARLGGRMRSASTVRRPHRFERWSPRRSISVDGDDAHGDPCAAREHGVVEPLALDRDRPASSRSGARAAGRGGRAGRRSRAARPRRRAARRATHVRPRRPPRRTVRRDVGRSGAAAGRWRGGTARG